MVASGAGTAILSGVKVLDFGKYIAGPYTATILGDLGADVIRIEPPEGNDDRFKIPLAKDGPGATFVQIARNKRSLTLDLTSADGQEVLRRLVKTADIVTVNAVPKVLKALGLTYEQLSAIKPDIIVAMGTGYGTGGPYSDRLAFDAIGQCLSGNVHLSGTADAPMRAQAAYCDFGTALYLTIGVLAAFLERQKSGKGQQVEASLAHTGLAFMSHLLVEQAMTGTSRPRTGNRGQTSGPMDLFKTKDGWIIIFVLGDVQFKRVAELVGCEYWLTDPRFVDDTSRGVNGSVLSADVEKWCASRTSVEALQALEKARVPCGPMLNLDQVLDDPHVRAMEFIKDVHIDDLGKSAPIVDLPVRFSRSETGVKKGPPALGAHSAEILSALNYSREDIEKLRTNSVV